MSVTQTVEIPANHRLTIDVPPEVPAGPVILTFTPKGEMPGAREDKKPATGRAQRLLGACSSLGDITLEKIREERLGKYL